MLCGGMGGRAAAEFQSRGIQPLVVKFPGPAATALTAYLEGALPSVEKFCRCHE